MTDTEQKQPPSKRWRFDRNWAIVAGISLVTLFASCHVGVASVRSPSRSAMKTTKFIDRTYYKLSSKKKLSEDEKNMGLREFEWNNRV